MLRYDTPNGQHPQCCGAQPIFVVYLRPEPGIDGVRALKAALKVILRRYGLRCVALKQVQVARLMRG